MLLSSCAFEGDTVVPPPPVPEAAPVGGQMRRSTMPRSGARIAPSMRFDCPGGHLQLYPSDGRITATCTNVMHGSCVLTRFVRVKSRMGGRPCGMMVAWLNASPMVESHQDHFALVPEFEADYGTRVASRVWMAEQPGGIEFLSIELNAESGLEVEPEKA